MATETSNIDDLLLGNKASTQPDSPELREEIEDAEQIDYEQEEASNEQDTEVTDTDDEEPTENEETEEKAKPRLDEYGNEKPKSKMYTEEEKNEAVSDAIRRRLREKHEQQPTQQQVQQQAEGFEYNPESSESWKVQLEQFVEQTVSNMGQKQQRQVQQQREQEAELAFTEKFTQGMDRFGDFRDVVGKQPITDAMTLALRGINDPSAFIYAASKRHPGELQRISQMGDQYAQLVEMGKLEERMRKGAVTTKVPHPVSRTQEDGTVKTKSKPKEPSIEDLIAKSESKKRALMESRRRK